MLRAFRHGGNVAQRQHMCRAHVGSVYNSHRHFFFGKGGDGDAETPKEVSACEKKHALSFVTVLMQQAQVVEIVRPGEKADEENSVVKGVTTDVHCF
jgi:hypothetical protein